MRLSGACILILLMLFPDISAYGQSGSKALRWVRRAPRFLKKMVTGYTIDDKILYYDKIVIGTEPSWLLDGDAEFDGHKFKLLSDLVVAEYDINPLNGSYRSASAFKNHLTSTVEIKNYGDDEVALANATILDCADILNPQINFLVQLTYQGDFGKTDRSYAYLLNFLGNTEKEQGTDLHRTVVDSLRRLANIWGERDRDIRPGRRGLMIDFTNVRFTENAHAHFVGFVKTLHDDLAEYFTLFYLKVDAKALPPQSLISDIAPYIDLFVVKAYSFETDPSEPAAPTAVFDSTASNSLQAFLHNTLEHGIPHRKTVLEFPYFTTSWVAFKKGTWSPDPERHLLTYNDLQRRMGRTGEIQHRDSSFAYVEIPSTDPQFPPRLYCFEDSLTLAAKYRWLDRQGLPGVALWGLGYNTGNESLKYWEAVADRYSRPPPEIVWYGVGLVFFLMSMGFPYALLHSWEVRNITAKYTKYAWRVIGISLLFFLFFLICSNPGLRNTVGLMVGVAILAIYAFLMIIRRYLMRARRYMRYAGVKT